MSDIIYKIRAADGSFSRGGCYVHFTKNGKTWTRAGDVSNHLVQLSSHGLAAYERAGAQIVMYRITQEDTHTIAGWIKGVTDRREERNHSSEVRWQEQHQVDLARTIEQKRLELAVLERQQIIKDLKEISNGH